MYVYINSLCPSSLIVQLSIAAKTARLLYYTMTTSQLINQISSPWVGALPKSLKTHLAALRSRCLTSLKSPRIPSPSHSQARRPYPRPHPPNTPYCMPILLLLKKLSPFLRHTLYRSLRLLMLTRLLMPTRVPSIPHHKSCLPPRRVGRLLTGTPSTNTSCPHSCPCMVITPTPLTCERRRRRATTPSSR